MSTQLQELLTGAPIDTMQQNEQWRTLLLSSRKKTVATILEHAKLISDYAKTCNATLGWGSKTFNTKLEEWLGYSPSTAAYWKQIGDNSNKFVAVAERLPASMRTLYEISSYSEAAIEKAFEQDGPNTTQQQVIAFKKALTSPAATTAPVATQKQAAAESKQLEKKRDAADRAASQQQAFEVKLAAGVAAVPADRAMTESEALVIFERLFNTRAGLDCARKFLGDSEEVTEAYSTLLAIL